MSAAWLFYGVTVLAGIVLRRARPEAARHYRVGISAAASAFRSGERSQTGNAGIGVNCRRVARILFLAASVIAIR